MTLENDFEQVANAKEREMGHWAALLGPERLAEALAKVRADNAAQWGIEKFTCDDCPAAKTCEWAFDSYNTDGDCLAEK